MKPKIALVTIISKDVPSMVAFYRDVLGFQMKTGMGEYVEFESEGLRFAICSHTEMERATGNASFQEPRAGQSFELAFPLDSPRSVDRAFQEIVAKGATPIREPRDMPWGQRAAFFADPDGNIHELFADMPREGVS